jgi:hypothetical protein
VLDDVVPAHVEEVECVVWTEDLAERTGDGGGEGWGLVQGGCEGGFDLGNCEVLSVARSGKCEIRLVVRGE